MSRLYSPARRSGFTSAAARVGGIVLVTLASVIAAGSVVAAEDGGDRGIKLELSPRVCTLAAGDESCDTTVTAQWHAPQDESLCLLIVDHPQIKRCWEHHSEGIYAVRLEFNRDLLVELRDPQLQTVLAAEAIAVIKEALRLRRKRRQPWDILS